MCCSMVSLDIFSTIRINFHFCFCTNCWSNSFYNLYLMNKHIMFFHNIYNFSFKFSRSNNSSISNLSSWFRIKWRSIKNHFISWNPFTFSNMQNLSFIFKFFISCKFSFSMFFKEFINKVIFYHIWNCNSAIFWSFYLFF